MAEYEPIAFPSWVFALDGTPRIVNSASEFAALPGSNWSFAPFVTRRPEAPMPTPAPTSAVADLVVAQANANATDATIQKKLVAATRTARLVTTGTSNPRHGRS